MEGRILACSFQEGRSQKGALGQQLAPRCSLKVFIGPKLLQDSLDDANCLHRGPQQQVKLDRSGGPGWGEAGSPH